MASHSQSRRRRRDKDEGCQKPIFAPSSSIQEELVDKWKLDHPREFAIQDRPIKQTLCCGVVVRKYPEEHEFVVRIHSGVAGNFVEMSMATDFVIIKQYKALIERFLVYVNKPEIIYDSGNVVVEVVPAASGTNQPALVKISNMDENKPDSKILLESSAFRRMMSLAETLTKEYYEFEDRKVEDQQLQDDLRSLIAYERNERRVNEYIDIPEWYKRGAITTWERLAEQIRKSRENTATVTHSPQQERHPNFVRSSAVANSIAQDSYDGNLKLSQPMDFPIEDYVDGKILGCGTEVHALPGENQFGIRIYNATSGKPRTFIEMGMNEFRIIKAYQHVVKQHIYNDVSDRRTIYAPNEEFSIAVVNANRGPVVEICQQGTPMYMGLRTFDTMMSLDSRLKKEYAKFEARNDEDRQLLDDFASVMAFIKNGMRGYSGMTKLPDWYKAGAKTSFEKLMEQASKSNEKARKRPRMSTTQ